MEVSGLLSNESNTNLLLTSRTHNSWLSFATHFSQLLLAAYYGVRIYMENIMTTSGRSNTPKLNKVSMNLTQRDIENALFLLEALNERSQASVVSKSLSLTKDIVELLSQNSKLLVEDNEGNIQEIKIVGL